MCHIHQQFHGPNESEIVLRCRGLGDASMLHDMVPHIMLKIRSICGVTQASPIVYRYVKPTACSCLPRNSLYALAVPSSR